LVRYETIRWAERRCWVAAEFEEEDDEEGELLVRRGVSRLIHEKGRPRMISRALKEGKGC
jgi:hypothetical protein